MLELFGFDYQLEMFKPASQRRWGYYALPILDGDQFVGKLDATANHDAGTLDIHALHEDTPFTERMEKCRRQGDPRPGGLARPSRLTGSARDGLDVMTSGELF